jgi:hypothetical protein
MRTAVLEAAAAVVVAGTQEVRRLAAQQLQHRAMAVVQGFPPAVAVRAGAAVVRAASATRRPQASRQTEAQASVARSQALALAALAAARAA